MKRQVWGLCCMAGLLATLSQSGTAQERSSEADKTAIRDVADAITAAEARGDFDAFMSFHTDDVLIMPPDQPVVVGKEAFRSSLRPFFEQFTLEETLSYSDLRVAGDWAVGTYTYAFTTTPKTGGGPSREVGKGVMLFRRMGDGSWKVSQAVWNRDDAPLPSALDK